MGRTVFIVILVVATVCALKSAFQRAAVSTQTNPLSHATRGTVLGTTNSDIVSETASETFTPNNALVELGPTSESASPGKESESAASEDEEINPLEGNSTVAFASASSAKLPGLQSDADLAPVEATILKEEEENGQVTFQASTANDFMLQLNDIVQNHQYTASYDLLTLFRGELDSDSKEAILSMASLLRRDQNTRLLLEMALANPQPLEIRAQAAAFAAARPDQHLDLLLGHLTDSDPLVQMTIANAFLDTKPTTTIIGARAEPDAAAAAPSRPN